MVGDLLNLMTCTLAAEHYVRVRMFTLRPSGDTIWYSRSPCNPKEITRKWTSSVIPDKKLIFKVGV